MQTHRFCRIPKVMLCIVFLTLFTGSIVPHIICQKRAHSQIQPSCAKKRRLGYLTWLPQEDLDKRLCEAFVGCDLESINNYLEIGAKIPSDRTNYLLPAIDEDDVTVIQCFIDHGGDVNVPLHKHEPETLLKYAVGNCAVAVVEALITAGANINACDNEYHETPLHYAIEWDHNSDTPPRGRAVIELLVNNPKINVNAQDEHGNTLLHCAVRKNFYYMVKLLLNLNAMNYESKKPLILGKDLMDAVLEEWPTVPTEVVDCVILPFVPLVDLEIKNNKGATAFDLAKTPEMKELFFPLIR